jgi:hypothetical protein
LIDMRHAHFLGYEISECVIDHIEFFLKKSADQNDSRPFGGLGGTGRTHSSESLSVN